jgi:hypothetical protein
LNITQCMPFAPKVKFYTKFRMLCKPLACTFDSQSNPTTRSMRGRLRCGDGFCLGSKQRILIRQGHGH